LATSLDIPLVEASAKTGEQIESIFRTIAENMLSSKDRSVNTSNIRVESNVIDLNETNNDVKKKKSCCG